MRSRTNQQIERVATVPSSRSISWGLLSLPLNQGIRMKRENAKMRT
jgi:hypothetical protein